MSVVLPKFKVTSEFRLEETLAALGMPSAFSKAEADFSGVDGQKRLFISAAIHKAYIDVNEEGTEAAAATTVHSDVKSDTKKANVFNADHPFLFLIRDTRSGSILFLGRLVDPRK